MPVSLAQPFKAQVFFLHVMEPPAYGLDFTLTHPECRLKPRVDRDHQKRSVEKTKKLGVDAEGSFVLGVPYAQIVNAAKEHKADLIPLRRMAGPA